MLHMEEIRSLLNMKVYVDTDDDVRLARRSGGWGRSAMAGIGWVWRENVGGQQQGSIIVSILLCAFQPAACLLDHRIQRDVAVRGRDVAGVIGQYTKFVKPAFDQFVAPSRKLADVIIPWARWVNKTTCRCSLLHRQGWCLPTTACSAALVPGPGRPLLLASSPMHACRSLQG